MDNAIWQLSFRWARCHTEDAPLKTRILDMKGARLANVYFYHEKRFAWDVDVPMGKVRYAEEMLGTLCDTSDNLLDPPAVPIPERIGHLIRRLRGVNGELVAEPLPPKFSRSRVVYEVWVRNDTTIIYKATPYNPSGTPWYDLIVPNRRKGNGAGLREIMPESEGWGKRAWSFNSVERAMKEGGLVAA